MKFPKPLTITSRVSSITNSFVQAIIPNVPADPGEVEGALRILGMTYDSRTCVYCGTPATDWDHLRPLVKDKQPTGYVNEIRNLVPACGPCNQSKSGADWRKWMQGAAKGSPKAKRVSDIEERIKRLSEFEQWGNVMPMKLEQLGGADLWKAHWENLRQIEQAMRIAQEHAVLLRAAIAQGIKVAQTAAVK
jgi:hypothetical protein